MCRVPLKELYLYQGSYKGSIRVLLRGSPLRGNGEAQRSCKGLREGLGLRAYLEPKKYVE